jgi:hypothetical protein
MRQGDCDKCKDNGSCADADNCYKMAAELNRITKGRKKQIIPLYEHNMDADMRRWFNNVVYGAYDGDE